MKTMSVGELKAHFSEALKDVIAGEEIGITFGKKKEVVATLVKAKEEIKPRRKLGILEGKAKAVFAKDFKMTEEEFLNL